MEVAYMTGTPASCSGVICSKVTPRFTDDDGVVNPMHIGRDNEPSQPFF